MLTRLRVSGFKNLMDVDIFFGPFTCVAGANGVGKSNLFDAITFLSALADRPLMDAALSVRDEGGRTADIRSLFHRVGDRYADEMSFETEMIVPSRGVDDLGQEAKATITFLRYALSLAYRKDDRARSPGSIEILKEELTHIKRGDAAKHLNFPHRVSSWRESVLQGRRAGSSFISMQGEGPLRQIRLHQDGGSRGPAVSRLAANLPRTVLSAANAAESPTVVLARREMQSWRLLQLEPSSLRRPDEFTAPTRVGVDGSHLAAALYHLARGRREGDEQFGSDEEYAASVYARIANRLAELSGDVRDVWVDRDDRREILTLQVRDREGTSHPARSLSDGTLRFLALVVLELEPESHGLLCLEEPENGIHPARISVMLQLLQDIAMDVDEKIGPDNPMRQVIINTHSPLVVSQVPDDCLVMAELKETIDDGRRYKRVSFSSLPNTWRQQTLHPMPTLSKGELLAYLNPVGITEPDTRISSRGQNDNGHREQDARRVHRVIDRPDLQPLLPFLDRA